MRTLLAAAVALAAVSAFAPAAVLRRTSRRAATFVCHEPANPDAPSSSAAGLALRIAELLALDAPPGSVAADVPDAYAVEAARLGVRAVSGVAAAAAASAATTAVVVGAASGAVAAALSTSRASILAVEGVASSASAAGDEGAGGFLKALLGGGKGAGAVAAAAAERGARSARLSHGKLYGSAPGAPKLAFIGGPALAPVLDDEYVERAVALLLHYYCCRCSSTTTTTLPRLAN